MVAIVTGAGLGLQSSSALGLGSRGQLGQANLGGSGEQAYINAATGNLVLRGRDQLLIGQGINGELYRAYNSQAELNGESWRPGTSKTVGKLLGTAGALGSTVVRTDWDGSETAYEWSDARKCYVARSGVGARDTLVWNPVGQQWTWSKGSGEISEHYAAAQGGRLISQRDRDGNAVEFSYNADGLLSRVRTASGEETLLDYVGKQLRQVRTVGQGGAVMSTAVRYGYDAQGRLSTVTVDLSPEDHSIADGRVYTTKYGYDGTSARIASITESDGTQVAIGYTKIGTQYRVASVTEVIEGGTQRLTTLTYDLDGLRTVIRDSFGEETALSYDAQGQLLQVVMPEANGRSAKQSFGYDANGQVAWVRDGEGHQVRYSYDSAGNCVKQEDDRGSLVERVFGPGNLLMAETVKVSAGGAATTRYAYDSEGHLRFAVSAEGGVTEFRYSAQGQIVSELRYRADRYPTAGSVDEAALATWSASAARRDMERIDTSYDFRGNIARVQQYARLDAMGNGIVDSDTLSARYIYDPSGRLLQRFVGAEGAEKSEQFVYDGLGRQIAVRGFEGVLTTTHYDDADRRVSVTFSNGLIRTSTFNQVGHLIGVVERTADTLLSEVAYQYDRSGRLRVVVGTNGGKTHYLYDEAGRRVAEVDSTGTLTEYVLDGNGRVERTLRYATQVDASALLDSNGRVLEVLPNGELLTYAAAGIKPGSSIDDRRSWHFYDAAGNRIKSVGADGRVTDFEYDAASRLVRSAVRALRLDITQFVKNPIIGNAQVAAQVDGDKATRYFYDADGRISGEQDADGYVTKYVRDGAGRITQTIRYSSKGLLKPTQDGTLAQILPGTYETVYTSTVFDARGLRIAEISGEGHVTRYSYDAKGQLSGKVQGLRLPYAGMQDRASLPPTTFSGTVRAKATSANGQWPEVEVWLDGVKVQTLKIASASEKSYTFTAAVTPGQGHEVRLVFSNGGDGRSVTIAEAEFAGRRFDADGRVLKYQNGAGSWQPAGSQTLNSPGDLCWSVDALHLIEAMSTQPGLLQRTKYEYNADGLLLSERNYSSSGDLSVAHEYDDQGRVVRTQRGDRIEHYRYDAQGRLSAALNGEGGAALQALGASASAVAINAVWAQHAVSYRYDAGGRRTALIDPLGRTTLYYYDAQDRLTHTVNPLGEVVEMVYNAFGEISQTITYGRRVSSLNDLRGGVLTAAAKALFAAMNDSSASKSARIHTVTGAIAKELDALGYATTYSYSDARNAFGAASSVTRQFALSGADNRLDASSSLTYNMRGQLVQTATAFYAPGVNGSLQIVGSRTIGVNYDAFGQVQMVNDGTWPYWETHYHDLDGNRNGVNIQGRGKDSLSLDAFGRVLVHTDRTGNKTTYSYTEFGREVTVTTPEGVVTRTLHNEHGEVVEFADGRGNATRYQYDKNGQLIATTDAAGTRHQVYDRAGQLVETVDARGMRIILSYDAAGRVLTRTVDPDGLALTTRYEYDAKGQAVRHIDAAGMVTETRFDLSGQAIEVTIDAGGQNLKSLYSYDGLGRVVRMVKGAGTNAQLVTDYGYDNLGRRTRVTIDPDGLALSTHLAYDINDNLISRTDAGGHVTRFVHDMAGRLIYTIEADGTTVRNDYDGENRLVTVTRYSQRIDLNGVAAGWKAARSDQNQALIASRIVVAEDRIERTVYDADGRARFQIDGAGYVTEHVYDASGNVTGVIRYATAVSFSSQPSQQQLASALLANPNDRSARTVFDAANRAIFAMDAAGYVTKYDYDSGGNVIRTWRSAEKYAGSVDEGALTSWVKGQSAIGSSRISQYIYDAAGRLAFEVDPMGWVTQRKYDSAGRVVAQTRHRVGAWAGSSSVHAASITLAQARAYCALNSNTVTGQWSYYDSAGRVRFEVSGSVDGAANRLQEYRYDSVGLLSQTRDYGVAGSGWATRNLVTSDWDVHAAGKAYRSTTQSYDAAGRLVETVDALGTVSRMEYDGQGRLTTLSEAHGTAQQSTTRYAYDTQGQLIEKTRAAGTAIAAVTRYAYSAFGEQSLVIDPRGVELSESDSDWALSQRKSLGYVNETGAALRVRDLDAGQRKDLAARYTSRREFDRAGNEVASTDAIGAVVCRTFDAFGNAVKVVDARGHAGNFYYDARDRVVASVDAAGYLTRTAYDLNDQVTQVQRYLTRLSGAVTIGAPPEAPAGQIATTVMRYDLSGRIVESIDAAGGRERWQYAQTSYNSNYSVQYLNKVGGATDRVYDGLGRMTQEAAPVAAAGEATRLTTGFEYDGYGNVLNRSERIGPIDKVLSWRTTRYSYDALNRLASTSIDGLGVTERRTYDRSGNVASITDGNGKVSSFYYDAANRQVGMVDAVGGYTRTDYDAAGNAIAVRRYEQLVAASGVNLPSASGPYRESLSLYDANNKLVETRILNVRSGRAEGDKYVIADGDVVQRWQYDLGGLLVAQTDGNGAVSRTWHDAMGQPVLQVDAAGYATAWDRDAEGNVLKETRFSSRGTQAITAQSDAVALAAAWPRNPADRVTEYVYDLNGRVLIQTHKYVAYGTLDANGRLTEANGDASTRYQWDAAGNLLSKVDANGHVFRWEYDVGGRMTAQIGAGFVGHEGVTVFSRTEYTYDGFNHVVKEMRIGAWPLESQGSTYEYDNAGRMTAKVNALGMRTTFTYDVVGNLTRMSRMRGDGSGIAYNEHVDYSYDAMNRETRRETKSSSASNPINRTRYNAFGEMTGRGTGETQWEVFAEYDNAGRMVKGNANRGIVQSYIYDGNGNQTLMLESQTTDLRGLAIDQALMRSDVFQTISVYDARNQLVDVIQPSMTTDGARLGLVVNQVEVLRPGQISSSVGGAVGRDPLAPQLGAIDGSLAVAGGSGTPQPLTGDHVYKGWKGGTDNHPPQYMIYRVNLPDYSEFFGDQYDVRVHLVGSYSRYDVPGGQVTTYIGKSLVVDQSARQADLDVNMNIRNYGNGFDYPISFFVNLFVTPKGESGGKEFFIGRGDAEATIQWRRNWNYDSRVDVVAGSLAVNIEPHLPDEFSERVIKLPIDGFRSDDISPQVYVRPKGSQGHYQMLSISRDAEKGMATADITGLVDGAYEVLYLAEHTDGTLKRREQYDLTVGAGRSITRVDFTPSSATALNGAGTFVRSGGSLHMLTLRSLRGEIPADVVVEYRRKGSNHSWISVGPLGGVAPLTTPGSVAWSLTGMSGDYEVRVHLRNGLGATLDTLVGEVGVESGRVNLDYPQAPSTIQLGNLPPAASTVSFAFLRADGSVAATVGAMTIADANNLAVPIPTALLAEAGNSFAKYTLVATFQDGHVVNADGSVRTYTARGDIQVGPQRQPGAVLNTDQNLFTVNLEPRTAEGTPVAGGQALMLHYRAEGDVNAPFQQVLLRRGAGGNYRWDSLGLDPAKTYEYFYDVFAGVAQAQAGDPSLSLVRNRGYFFPDANRGAVETRWEISNIDVQTSTIHRQQRWNAFGEVATEIDGRGNETELTYNTLGNLTLKRGPQVEVTHANGFRDSVRPETRYIYDRVGSLVGYQDANGNLTTQAWNYGTGQPTIAMEWRADGSVMRYQYDILGNRRVQIDALGRRSDYSYDRENRLVRSEGPVRSDGTRAWDTYEYDEWGHRIAQSNALGRSTTKYDTNGQVTRTVSAAGRTTEYSRVWVEPANGQDGYWKQVVTDANGRSTTDTVDAHGRKLSHVDLGGRRFDYSYNFAGLLARDGSTSYQYYGNGLLMRMKDEASGTDGYYEYDRNGNRTFEGFTGKDKAWAFQQSTGTYDALNRLVRVQDPRYVIDYEYDAVGNRIHMYSNYKDALGGKQAEQDYWYQYDAMNRFVVTMGQLKDGRRGATAQDGSAFVWLGSGGDGVRIAYDMVGQRREATYARDGHTEYYSYDAQGYLTDTHMRMAGDASKVLRARRVNDIAGRVSSYSEYLADGRLSQSITHTWDADSQLIKDVVQRWREDSKGAWGFETTHTDTYRLANGTVSWTDHYKPGDNTYTRTKTYYTYEWYDTARQTEIRVDASNKEVKGQWAAGFSKFVYDDRGNLKLAYDVAGQRGFYYQADGEGRILQRDELIGGQVDGAGNVSNAQQNRFHSYYLYDDRQVGNIGNDGVDRIDYAKELAQRERAARHNPDADHKRFGPMAGADFDVNYQPINSLYPTAAPGTYVVREGDTLTAIAAALWGDSSLWYVLAEANGLTANQALIANTTLSVPNKVLNVHNNASTFKPYDAGQAIGNVNPTLPEPPPPPRSGGGCGGFAKVLAIVVAVVVTIYTAGIASGAAWGLTSAMSAGMSAGAGAMAAGAAVGSVASQGVLMAAGEQSGFDWKGVALAAVGGAVTAGVVQSPLAQNLAATRPVVGGLATGAVTSTVNSGLASVLDVSSFNWKGIGISAVAAASGHAAGRGIERLQGTAGLSTSSDWSKAVRGFGSGVTAGAASALIRGNMSGEALREIGLDVLGSTLGNAIADGAVARSMAAQGPGGQWEREDALMRERMIQQEEQGRLADIQLTAGTGIGRVRENPRVLVEYLPEDARSPLSESATSTAQRVAWLEQTGRENKAYYDGFRGSVIGDAFAEGGTIFSNAGMAIGQGLVSGYGLLTDLQYGRQVEGALGYAATHPLQVAGAVKGAAAQWWASPLEDKVSSIATEAVATIASGGLGLVRKADAVQGVARIAEKAVPDHALQAEIARIGQEGHALGRHGGSITDEQLYIRATTGVAPDGSSVSRNGQVVIPPSSTAFYSDELLAQSDVYIRQNYLDRAVALGKPGAQRVTIEGVELGRAVGRGYDRLSATPGGVGPLNFHPELSRATGVYDYDLVTNSWRTTTIFVGK